jgi:hypothetical protein
VKQLAVKNLLPASLLFRREDRGRRFHQNFGTCLLNYTIVHSRSILYKPVGEYGDNDYCYDNYENDYDNDNPSDIDNDDSDDGGSSVASGEE